MPLQRIVIDPDIKALIFDCDGTLVDSMPTHMHAWREAFVRFGVNLDERFIAARRGMKETEIVRQYNDAFRTGIDPERIVDLKHQIFLSHLDQVAAIEPVVAVANLFHGKLPLAVVSGGVKKVVQSELLAVGILDLFEVILTADDPYRPKPDPEIFLEASRRMKVDPSFCLVFEDGDAGLIGAAGAGMKALDVRSYMK